MLHPAPGTVVGGKYRLLRPLGEGGMATVFEAENTVTLRRAAIKWLHPRYRGQPDASKRLIYEARAAARVRHRNVVDIYDVLEEGQSVFLVMELLLGESLGDYLTHENMAVHEVIALLLPAMRGVAAAHAVGVVHRDIKPDNIFLSREDGSTKPVPKVIDFGISRISEPSDGRLTRSGVTMGTPRYVSFEQLRGARDVDARADVYAFGVILYETIVGRPPYDASSLGQQAISFMTSAPPEPQRIRPNVPGVLNALVLAAIAREREQRLATIEQLIAGLEPFASPNVYGGRVLPAYAPNRRSMPTGPSEWSGTTLPGDASTSSECRVPRTSDCLPVASSHPRSVGLTRAGKATLAIALTAIALIAVSFWGPWSERRSPGPAPRTAQHEADPAPPSAAPASLSAQTTFVPPVASQSEIEEPAIQRSVAPPPQYVQRERRTRATTSDPQAAIRRPLRPGDDGSAEASKPPDAIAPVTRTDAAPSGAPAESSGPDMLHRAAKLQRSQF